MSEQSVPSSDDTSRNGDPALTGAATTVDSSTRVARNGSNRRVRKRKKTVIALDNIRAVATPDQLLADMKPSATAKSMATDQATTAEQQQPTPSHQESTSLGTFSDQLTLHDHQKPPEMNLPPGSEPEMTARTLAEEPQQPTVQNPEASSAVQPELVQVVSNVGAVENSGQPSSLPFENTDEDAMDAEGDSTSHTSQFEDAEEDALDTLAKTNNSIGTSDQFQKDSALIDVSMEQPRGHQTQQQQESQTVAQGTVEFPQQQQQHTNPVGKDDQQKEKNSLSTDTRNWSNTRSGDQDRSSINDVSDTSSGSENECTAVPPCHNNPLPVSDTRVESQPRNCNAVDKKQATTPAHMEGVVTTEGSDGDDSTGIVAMAGLSLDEVNFLHGVRNDIDEQEERTYLQQVADNIDQQEEKEVLDDMEHSISRKESEEQVRNQGDKGARERESPGGGEEEEEDQRVRTVGLSPRDFRKPSCESQVVPAEEQACNGVNAVARIDAFRENEGVAVRENEGVTASSANANHVEMSENPIPLMRVSKRLPRELGTQAGQKDSYLSIDTFSMEITSPFQQSLSSNESSLDFSCSLSEIPGDEESFLLTAEGGKEILEKFRVFFSSWFQVQWARRCHQDLLQDEKSVKLDVVLNKDDLLSVWAEELLVEVSAGGHSLGLWVDFADMTPSVQKLFGGLLGEKAMGSAALAVAISCINEVECRTREDWNELGYSLQDTSDVDVLATIYVSGYVDLSSLGHSRVVGGTSPPVRVVTVDSNKEIVESDIEVSLTSKSTGENPTREEGGGLAHRPYDAEAAKAHRQFMTKYKPVYDIEYHRSEIGYQFVMSQMWTRHKEKFGSEGCEADCPCALELDILTELVVQKWVSQQLRKAKRGWKVPEFAKDIHDSPVGFVNRFVPKFLPLLEEKFPNDNPGQLLERLIRMWNKGHLAQTNFGSRCEKSCTCKDGWISVFKQGNTDVLLAGVKKKRSAGEFTQAIPRKRFRSEATCSDVPISQRKKPQTAPGIQGTSSLIDQVDAEFLRRDFSDCIDRRDERTEYGISFSTKVPLGFYCITEDLGDRRVCKITSVCPTGASMNHKFIQAGVCVDAVEIWQVDKVKYNIQGHEELLQYYNLAKEKKVNLKLWFSMKKVDLGLLNGDHTKDWSNKGEWCGLCNSGWPGGAHIIPVSAISPMHPRPRDSAAGIAATTRMAGQAAERFLNVRQPNPPPGGNSSETVDVPIPTLAFVGEIGPQTPKHRYARPTSPVMKKTFPTMKEKTSNPAKRVRFGNCNSERYYEKASPSCRLLSSSASSNPDLTYDTRISAGASPPGNEGDSLAKAIKAVRSNNPQNLVKALQESGHVHTAQFVQGENWLSREYDFAKTNDFDTVRVILSILKSASMAIKIAQSLKSWCAYRIRVEKITGLQLTERWASEPGLQSFNGSIEFCANRSGKDLPLLPPMDITQIVDYGAGGVAALPEYNALHFNSGLPEEARELVFQLNSIKGEKRTLAKLVIPLMGIHARCYAVGKDVAIEREFSCSEFILKGAKPKLHLQARRCHVLPSYVEMKKINGSKELEKVLDEIEQFNTDKDSKLNAKICGSQNFSLLHAAIVFERPDLITRLLSLGADPNYRGDQGSPVAFAMSMADRQREKLQFDDDKGSLEESKRLRLEEKVQCLENIARELLLHSNFQKQSGNLISEALHNPQNVSGLPHSLTRTNLDELPQERQGNLAIIQQEQKDTNPVPSQPSEGTADVQPIDRCEPDTLPTLTDRWFIPAGQPQKPCMYFRDTLDQGCKRGRECFYPHIQPPVEDLLNNELTPICLTQDIAYWERPDVYGKPWITAVYRDPNTKIYYRAEGGFTGRKNSQSIWWYPSEMEAKKAVEFVYVASTYNGTATQQMSSRASREPVKGHYGR